MSEHAR